MSRLALGTVDTFHLGVLTRLASGVALDLSVVLLDLAEGVERLDLRVGHRTLEDALLFLVQVLETRASLASVTELGALTEVRLLVGLLVLVGLAAVRIARAVDVVAAVHVELLPVALGLDGLGAGSVHYRIATSEGTREEASIFAKTHAGMGVAQRVLYGVNQVGAIVFQHLNLINLHGVADRHEHRGAEQELGRFHA